MPADAPAARSAGVSGSAVAPLPQFAHAPLLVLISLLLMLLPLSTDFYLASLPGLAHGFGAPAATVQLTLTLFAVGFGFAQLAAGPLSDRFGRRPVLLWGLALYAAASALCALAPTIEVLIGARVLQSLGCCCGVVVGRALVRDAYAPQHNARVIARASSWLAVAPICGPILGSWLQVAFGWRAAFVALTLFSAALLAVALLRLPETNAHKDPRATELAGVLANYRIVLGAREFWAHAAPGALSYGGIFLFISGMSLALIDILKVPTARFGYCFGFGVCGYLAGTMLCRRLLARYGSGRTLKIGTAVSLATGALFLAAVAAGVLHWSLVVAAMFLTMGAHGLNFPVAQSGAVAPFPQQAATAAGLMGALYMLVAFVVGSALGASYDGTLYPMAAIACALGVAIFCVVRALPGAAPAAR